MQCTKIYITLSLSWEIVNLCTFIIQIQNSQPTAYYTLCYLHLLYIFFAIKKKIFQTKIYRSYLAQPSHIFNQITNNSPAYTFYIIHELQLSKSNTLRPGLTARTLLERSWSGEKNSSPLVTVHHRLTEVGPR